jgi:hypothetical protein
MKKRKLAKKPAPSKAERELAQINELLDRHKVSKEFTSTYERLLHYIGPGPSYGGTP